MRRVDNPPDDLFIDGDPSTSTQGTVLLAQLMNSWQEELANILENWGITLVESNDGQLSAALTDIINIASFVGKGRGQFTYVDANQITIEPFAYHHNGTKEQLLISRAQINQTFLSLAVSDWSYLYLDDSAIVSSGSNIIYTGQLIDSVLEPSWSVGKQGWYRNNDKCIFAVLTDSSGDILEFVHSGEMCFFGSQILDFNEDVDLTWLDVTLSLPIFTTIAFVTFLTANSPAANTVSHWRTKGLTGTGHIASNDATGSLNRYNSLTVICDSNQQIQIVHDTSDVTRTHVYLNAWQFPTGI